MDFFRNGIVLYDKVQHSCPRKAQGNNQKLQRN